jgi:release factor glutamine methyltransferase
MSGLSLGHAVQTVTIAEAIRHGAERLRDIADQPRLESRLLLAHALGVTQNDLIRDPHRPIDPAHFDSLLTRRLAHEPVALIAGYREFWSLPFAVSRSTLIPRPDSETLVEAALAAFAGRAPPQRVIDLGTGTGCLLLATLSEFRQAFGIGVDISPDALALGQTNATELGLADRASFVVSDWTNSIDGSFDLVISNPPYIRHGDILALMPEVRSYEPVRALDGGADGYDAYRAIVPTLERLLRPDGVAILELGEGQATYVSDIARAAGLDLSLRLDLAGIPRAMLLRRLRS